MVMERGFSLLIPETQCVTGQATHDWNPLYLHVESAN